MVQEAGPYYIGMKVELWEEDVDFNAKLARVVRRVVVTITDIKLNAPYEQTGEPSSGIALRGMGDDGKVYEKHWHGWPLSQTNDGMSNWSMRDDSEFDPNGWWFPCEAVHTYNKLASHNRQCSIDDALTRVGADECPIFPTGDDVTYCKKHDYYHYTRSRCFPCMVAARKAA